LVTYGLYCIHFIVISIILGLTKLTGFNNKLWQVLLLEPMLSLLITIFISLISYHYFEAPFLKLKEKFAFSTKKKQPIANSTA
jgi:peptidoglycan/LPS O-acetylase OafA/YrhL